MFAKVIMQREQCGMYQTMQTNVAKKATTVRTLDNQLLANI